MRIARPKPASDSTEDPVKKTALLCGVVAAALTAALIIGLRSLGKADIHGFLGPPHGLVGR